MSIRTISRVVTHDFLAEQVNRMIADAELNESEKLPREIYPIFAMPIVGGDYSLSAKAIKHRNRAVKIFNGVTEVWLPRSQIRRIVDNQIIVFAWIVERKREYFTILKNKSPQYQEWLENNTKEKEAVAQWIRNGGGMSFSCQLDGSDCF